ncbi:MAG TPA: cyclase family protein [Candidatus Nanopelagicaceae bacterium]
MSYQNPLKDAQIYDLAQPMKRGMPQSPNHPPFRMLLERRHGDQTRPDGSSASNDLIITGAHVGTHIDALGHVSHNGLLHGGIKAADVQSNDGLRTHGIDEFVPFLGKGVLLDIAGLHGVKTLPPGYEVTVDDLERAQQMDKVEVQEGDAVLIGTGWSRRWSEHKIFIGATDGAPGLGAEGAQWLASKKIALTGGETIAYEVIRAGNGHSSLPVHRIMLVEHGIFIMETMRLHELLDSEAREFLLIVSPLPIVGGTGSPVRPLAVVNK